MPDKQSFRAVLCTLIYISTFVPNINFGQDEHKSAKYCWKCKKGFKLYMPSVYKRLVGAIKRY